MENENIVNLLNLLISLLVVSLLILLIPITFAYFNENPKSIQEIAEFCKEGNISEASSCVVKVTSGFYKYNEENIGKNLTFDELILQGGVCSSWSDYYNEIGKNLGYNTENLTIPVSGNVYHRISIWSNEEGYCVIDQTKVSCFDFS